MVLKGVYKITNLFNNKIYFGSSRDMEHRLKTHKKNLEGNKHPNYHLQDSWNKYGEENFKFEVYSVIENEDINKVEENLIEKHRTYNRNLGYNLIRNTADMSKMSGKRIEVVNLKTNESEIFNSLKEIERIKGINPPTVNRRLKTKTYKGDIVFKLPEENIEDYKKVILKKDLERKSPKINQIYLINEQKELVKVFHSIPKCAEYLNIDKENIRQYIRNNSFKKIKLEGVKYYKQPVFYLMNRVAFTLFLKMYK